MPTYEYQCLSCGHELEIFQQMSDPLKRKCPVCGRLKLQRLIGTGSGVIFHGGGFYETDYRCESYRKSAEAEKKAAVPAAAGAGKCACGADATTKAANGCASDTPAKNRSRRAENRDPIAAQ